MRNASIGSVFGLLALCSMVTLPGYAEIPALIEDPEGGPHLWKTLEASRDEAVAECQSFSRSATGLQLPDLSSRSFLEMAEVALIGKVVSSAQGLFYGQPATLVEVDPERWLKRPTEIPAVDRVYVRFSRAELEIDGELVCVRNDHYPDQPTPRGRIVLFSEILSERLPLLLNPHSQAVIFERADGTVSLGWERGEFVGQSPTWESVENWLTQSH